MKSSHIMAHPVVALIVIISGKVRCSPVLEQDRDSDVRCDDIAEAIDYLHEHFPAHMTLADKCKRYAVLTSHIGPRKRLNSITVSQVSNMPGDRLNPSYQRLAAKNLLVLLFMTAIDGFRAASLIGPPLLELIECLKQFDDPSIQTYLNDEELNIIVGLYRIVQESPNTTIDLSRIPIFNRLRQGFVVSLISMFEDNIRFDVDAYQQLALMGIAVNSSFSPEDKDLPKEEMIGMEKVKIRRMERRRLATHRHREQEVLRSRRMKILSSSLTRDTARSRRKRNSRLTCADLAEAIDCLYENFPASMTLADKCKRYAVITSFVRPKARLAKTTVYQVLNMTEDQLRQSFGNLDANNQSGELFMIAIDGFRAGSEIGPAFLELVECLKQIDNEYVRKYLENEELKIILDIYIHALESPDTPFELNNIPNLGGLRQAFVTNLENLFKDRIHYEPISHQDTKNCSGVSERPVQEEEVTEPEIREMQRKERTTVAARRLKEYDVLRVRRMRILSQSLAHERTWSRRGQSSNVKCGDIAETITYLYENLLDSMTLADKCKRYAVIISYLEPTGRLHKEAVSHMMRLSNDRLDQAYQEFAANDQLGAFYMTAIDGLRAASVLGPPFLELIECLKQLNSESAQAYLKEEELNIIVELYKDVLKSPDTKIDLNLIPVFSKLRYGFLVTLMNMFKDHIKYAPASNHHAYDSGASGSKKPVSMEGMTESEDHELQRKEFKRLASHRNSEKNTLRARRTRILSPSLSRKKASSWLGDHWREEKIIEQAIRSDQSGQCPLGLPSSSSIRAHQQQRQPAQLEGPLNHMAETQLERPSLDSPALTRKRSNEVVRSMASLQTHRQEEQQSMLGISGASYLDPSKLDLQNQTCNVTDKGTENEQSQSGDTALMPEPPSTLEDPDAFVKSVSAPEAGSANNSNQLDVGDYLISYSDTFDQDRAYD